jgi:hypothetical protein
MKHILTWLAHETTTDHVSLVVAALAFVVAFWAGYQAKRSASATEKQARVASEQLWQSTVASNQAEKAAKEAKAVTWHDISDRLMERTARVVIGVEELKRPPILAGDILDESEYPRSAEPDQPKVLNSRSDRYSQVYYWVRGVIINEDTRSIQFIPLGGIRLIDGTTSLIDGEIKVPPKMHPIEGRYLLAPGKAALFEWRSALTVKQWIDYFNNAEGAQQPSAGIVAYPAGDPDSSSYIRIELDGCPVANNGMNDEVWEIIEYIRACAQVKSPRLVPPKALTGLLLALDESGSAGKDLRTWDLDIWARDALDLW